MAGDAVEGLGHVLDAEIGDANKGSAIALFHNLGEVHGRPGALHDVQGRPVTALYVGDAAVTGDVGHHLDTHLFEILSNQPDLAGQVEIADDIDRVLGDAGGVAGADQPGHGAAGRLVAGALVAFEAFGLHRQYRNAGRGGDFFADRLEIVADDADDAGRVDEGRLGMMAVDQFIQGLLKLFLAAEDDVEFLQVGGKGEAVQLRPDDRAPRMSQV
jgi:hypothetical protein